jgi:hypothetical protein
MSVPFPFFIFPGFRLTPVVFLVLQLITLRIWGVCRSEAAGISFG